MPGMNSGLNINDPIVVAAFRAALLHQGIAALLIFAVLSIAWVAVREWRPPDPGQAMSRPAEPAEPAWRQVLRIGFGLLWVFDGILQAQPAMAVGLPSKVIEPAAAEFAALAPAADQLGRDGLVLPPGPGRRVRGLDPGRHRPVAAVRLARRACPGWPGWPAPPGAWWCGCSASHSAAILAPGLSWLTGAPGAAAIYAVAGALIALPSRYWSRPWPGRGCWLGGTGVFLAGMAVLQAWPGRGYWQGTLHGQPGSLTSMVSSMASTSQPAALAAPGRRTSARSSRPTASP